MAILRETKKRKSAVKPPNAKKSLKKIKRRPEPHAEEITSSESEQEPDVKDDIIHSESEDETAQEKKMRLTKMYLEELKQLKQRDASDDERDVVGEQLQEDVLERAGRLQRKMADKCVAPEPSSIRFLKGHRLSVICLAISQDNSMLFTASKDCSIIKYDVKTGKKLHVIKGGKKIDGKCHKDHIMCLTISSDNKFLASGAKDKLIHIWDPVTCSHLHTFKGHRGAVSGLAFRKNSLQLFSSSHDRTVKVWDLEGMFYVETLYGHQDEVQACDSFIRQRCATAGGRDGTLRIWKIVDESQLLYHGHTGSIDCLRFINEEHMISGSDDGSVCLWNIMKKRPLTVLPRSHHSDKDAAPRETWISAVAALTNSDLVASGSFDGYVRVWKCGDSFEKLMLLFKVAVPGCVNDLRFSSDGCNLIAAVGQEHKLGRWWTFKDAKNGTYIIPLKPTELQEV